MKLRLPRRRTLALVLIGCVIGIALIIVGSFAVHATSTSESCMWCHEMKIVGEQGWMQSTHYDNNSGVVASCADCHFPAGFFPGLWVKTRDGARDVVVHFFGQSDPEKMDWAWMKAESRRKICDSSCLRCHVNLEPSGLSEAGKFAHRRYQNPVNRQRCLDCHAAELHGGFLKRRGEGGR